VSKPPFTPEQVVWLEQSRRESVKHATHHLRNQALIGYFILLVGIIITFGLQRHETSVRRADANAQRQSIVRSGSAVAVSGCNRDFLTITSLRRVLIDSGEVSKRAHARGLVSDQQYRSTQRFYQRQLHRLKLPDCRKAEHLITSNPERPLVVPVPLFPGK
jgi:hypothetical protein